MKIGMVGIGLMGHGIATNLQKHGHSLKLFEHPGNQPLDALVAGGAKTYSDLPALAANSDIIITVLTGSPQVEAVIAGPGGLLEGIKPGTVFVDCSTSLPESTKGVAQKVAAAKGRWLDAPMTRTPKEAAEGRLNLLVGGDAALLEEVMPVLKCFAENILHAGAVGAGHSMKLLHNYVSIGMVALLAEAAACSVRSGVSPEVFVDVLAKGGGGGIALERIKPFLLAGDISGFRFSLANARKDLGYYGEMVCQAHAAHDLADAVTATLELGLKGKSDGFMPELAAILGK
jgi:3-hydroxyisobutyrate dehydrogenase-like beta-hydroxyacid dehydrogenase